MRFSELRIRDNQSWFSFQKRQKKPAQGEQKNGIKPWLMGVVPRIPEKRPSLDWYAESVLVDFLELYFVVEVWNRG